MAGKHDGLNELSPTQPPGGKVPPVYPGSRVDKAYSEGRDPDAVTLGSDHPAGSPEFNAYESGVANKAVAADQVQTCWT